MKPLWRLAGLAAVAASLLLAGCATTRMIDSEVRSFSGAASVAAQTTYRFDHLPSTQAAPAQQQRLEELATHALARKGLLRNDTSAQYGVTLRVRAEQNVSPTLFSVFPSRWIAAPGGRRWLYRSLPVAETTEYRHTVEVLMRDTGSGQIVYESRAMHEGPWSDTLTLLPAILEAALTDYPQAVPAPHTVVVELPPNPPKTP